MPRLTDTVDELVEGTTSVTVLPLLTTVVGIRVVVAGSADVNGVLGGADSAGRDGPEELGLVDGVGAPGTSALVVTTALDGVAVGTEVTGVPPAGGAFVALSFAAGGGVAALSVGCCTVAVDV